MIYTILVTPYAIAFLETEETAWQVVDISVDVVFMLDILVTCVSAVQLGEKLVTSKKAIIYDYLKLSLIHI